MGRVSADDQRRAPTPAAELTLTDVTASTVANIGPGIDFYFMPLLGALALVVPFIELFQPGQPVPYSVFPYAAIGTLIAAGAYAAYLLARNPRAGSSEGSVVERTRA
jgi:hypothetical protein